MNINTNTSRETTTIATVARARRILSARTTPRAPGYIERVWNLPALSGVVLGGIPLEERLFGFAFGT